MALYLTPREVAAMWGCSARHVRRLCASGQLTAMRLGLDAWRIGVSAVEAYELAHTSGSVSSASAEAEETEPLVCASSYASTAETPIRQASRPSRIAVSWPEAQSRRTCRAEQPHMAATSLGVRYKAITQPPMGS